MPIITFIHPDGRSQTISAEAGASAMVTALTNGVDGILAECGGNAVCATCHVYVEDAWLGRLAPVGDDEDALLDGTATERRPNSRLSCQIRLTQQLDGLVLHLPEKQV
jgi:ferredoxin, 2Fe-2S